MSSAAPQDPEGASTSVAPSERRPGADGVPLVRLDGVTKRYERGEAALSNLSLEIFADDFLTFLGPSGCGKSTALRLIAGVEPPSSGAVTWSDAAGRDVDDRIGLVPQEPTLMPWATVAENVFLPLRLKGHSRREAAPVIEEALALVGLSRRAEAYPRELSGGMKMRVSIARALATRPRLILLDEPFAALDEIARFKLNDELLALKQKLGCTVVFVTHSVFESVYLSDRIVVMAARPGRVHRELRVEEPYPRTAAFRAGAVFGETCRAASAALEAAMAASGDDGQSEAWA